jgi:hypothetical protein
MTAQLDRWAITDHDPTSQAEALQQLALIATQQPPLAGDDIDELAVLQVAHDGLRLRLRGADRDEAVRMYGRVKADLIAWRLFTTARTVFRVAARLGLTEQKPSAAAQFGERRNAIAAMGCPAHAIASPH